MGEPNKGNGANALQPLETTQWMFVWLCVLPYKGPANRWRKLLPRIIISSMILATSCGLTASSAYIMKYITVDLEGSIYALFQICANLPLANAVVVTYFMRLKIITLFKRISDIYKMFRNDDSFKYLIEAAILSEQLWSFFLKFLVIVPLVSVASMPIVSVFYSFARFGYYDAQFVYHPFNFLLPWNQQQPLGYTAEICYSVIMVIPTLTLGGTILLFFIIICLHHQSFHKIFRQSIQTFDNSEKKNEQKFLRDLVQFHIKAKNCFFESAEIYSLFLLCQLICSTIYLACIILQLDLQFHNPNLNIFVLIPAASLSASNLFLYCYFGKLATESFEMMSIALYESKWSHLSVKSQKKLLIIMVNAQTPLYYHGFQIAFLNLETFTGLIRACFTYYMMFKTFTKN